MRTKHASDEALETWVDGAEQLRTHTVQAAFRAGWNAREQAPNTLILDTTDAQMVPIPQRAAAPAAVPLLSHQRFTARPFVPEPGFCACRHKVPLNADGSNPCTCCNEPVLDLPDDLY